MLELLSCSKFNKSGCKKCGRRSDRVSGDAYKVKRNDSEAFVAMSEDGTKCFRSDIDGHGDKPHAHLEIKNEHGNFKDATDQHRIYYKD